MVNNTRVRAGWPKLSEYINQVRSVDYSNDPYRAIKKIGADHDVNRQTLPEKILFIFPLTLRG